MSRGRVDYRKYKIKPQRNMAWPRAVQYMLQSEKNIVIGLPVKFYEWQKDPSVLHFRITEDRVLQYKPRTDDTWGNAAGHEFSDTKKFDALNCHESECDLETQDRIEYLEQQIEELKKKSNK